MHPVTISEPKTKLMTSREVYQVTCICGKQTKKRELQFHCANCGVESVICWQEAGEQLSRKEPLQCLRLSK